MTEYYSIDLLTAFLLVGAVNGFFFAWLLLKLRKNNYSANRFLAILLLAYALIMLHQFLVDTNLIAMVPGLLVSMFVVEVVIPPSLYLYVRAMTQPYKKDRHIYWFFLPALICFLLTTPVLFVDYEAKMAIVESNFIEWPGVLATTYPIYMAIEGIQYTVFLLLSFKLLFAHTQNIGHFFSYRENITLAWLRNFLLLYVVTWIFGSYYYYSFIHSNENIKPFVDLFYAFSVVVVFYLGTMGLLQRRIYTSKTTPVNAKSGLQQSSAIKTPESATNDETIDISHADKYRKSALSTEMSQRILNRLTNLMNTERPYLNNNLTLPELAAMVSTTPNYLSQVINEQLQMNFFDYVNSYRIEAAKELMINPLPHTHTILDVAMESAFNSKSAFYSAFKKKMGMTPSQYKKTYSV